MWHLHKGKLQEPLDFLKIGHHGSINATPWNDAEDGKVTEPSTILDAILPVQRARLAKAVASTLRKNYQSIPSAALLVEIGKRVNNSKAYEEILTVGGVKLKDLPFFARARRVGSATDNRSEPISKRYFLMTTSWKWKSMLDGFSLRIPTSGRGIGEVT
jgi:hypothetical protein